METNKKFGLYVHIPFCVSKCLYCDFASVVKNNTLIDEYTAALCKEMEMYRQPFSQSAFDTVFIGGGTPSCIPIDNLRRIIESIYKNFNTEIKEFSIEVNPGTGSKELFRMLYEMGINRASLGLQCADDAILKSIGRIHNVPQFIHTFQEVYSSGIKNINADIISGLPGQTKEHLIKSIDLAASLNAQHISMYTLKLEDNTPLKESVMKGDTILPSEDEEYIMSAAARGHLLSLGYQRYEISNYAKEGYECVHNLKYWKRYPYLGLGTAAASMYLDFRFTNTPDIKKYIEKINSDKFAIEEKSTLQDDEFFFEMIMLGTRLAEGMEYRKYDSFSPFRFKDKYADIIKGLADEGLIVPSDTHLILSEKGMDMQNNVLLRFMDED
ncbi:MAG: radical SAM family heme chaperone HemW [Clostridia bacterium]|nr:radical SAM family heme chaperone HemW [Clostridia bacterium]